jgi:hypothetical protein
VIGPLFAVFVDSIYWHVPFLITAICLVYSATRYDDWPSILRETVRWVIRMSVFLLVIAAALFILSKVI